MYLDEHTPPLPPSCLELLLCILLVAHDSILSVEAVACQGQGVSCVRVCVTNRTTNGWRTESSASDLCFATTWTLQEEVRGQDRHREEGHQEMTYSR
uniref:Putative secreted protein n=1 Tax=Anopheles triannulatus TaxID=58253 RepID=A0A2M4B3I4_9DIPT